MSDQEVPEKPSKGYGKRPMWQGIVLYVVIAIIVYGLIYLLFIHKSGGSSGGNTGGYGY
ncbi:MAG TPA: hypothetical protein VHB72_04110 [Candidatus Saccharimonadales bacterium]|nr:hypothetical protein [Candidatus Saccharimonadales bacterium]